MCITMLVAAAALLVHVAAAPADPPTAAEVERLKAQLAEARAREADLLQRLAQAEARADKALQVAETTAKLNQTLDRRVQELRKDLDRREHAAEMLRDQTRERDRQLDAVNFRLSTSNKQICDLQDRNRELLRSLARREGPRPPTIAKVFRADEKIILLDAGQEHNVQANQALDVYRRVGAVKIVAPRAVWSEVQAAGEGFTPQDGDMVILPPAKAAADAAASARGPEEDFPPPPPVIGRIQSIDGKRAVISLGADDGVAAATRFLVFRGDALLATFLVDKIDAESTAGFVVNVHAPVKVGDRVMVSPHLF